MAILGFLYLILLFVGCFVFVHFIKLALVGLRSCKPKPEEKKEEQPATKTQPPQPVYYIVEKKRAKRSSYSKPREIEFK